MSLNTFLEGKSIGNKFLAFLFVSKVHIYPLHVILLDAEIVEWGFFFF